MSNQPFLQLYVGDYLADTTDLTCEQHGAYLLILMTMWRHDAKLANDHQKLARIARLTPRKWAAVWEEISRFFVDDGEHIRNARLTKEHQKATEKSAVRAEAGRKGGLVKPLKDNEPTEANASDLLKHGQKPEARDQKEEGSYEPLPEPRSDGPVPTDDVAAAFIAWNAAAERNGWPGIQKFSQARRKALIGRLRDAGGLSGWEHALTKAEASDFLCGRTANPWTAFAFDWLVKPSNFTKLMEGNYDNRDNHAQRQPSQGRAHRPDAALENIARLTGLKASSGNGGF